MRFNYSAEFLDWCVTLFDASPSHCTDERVSCALRALKPPGYVKDWQVGVRVKSTGKLVAFISGIPVSLRARTKCVLFPLGPPRERGC